MDGKSLTKLLYHVDSYYTLSYVIDHY